MAQNGQAQGNRQFPSHGLICGGVIAVLLGASCGAGSRCEDTGTCEAPDSGKDVQSTTGVAPGVGGMVIITGQMDAAASSRCGEGAGGCAVGPAENTTGHDGGFDVLGDGSLEAQLSATPCNADASPRTNRCVISDAFSLFVSARGADTNDGTQARPFLTIKAALGAVTDRRKRVLVCNAAPFTAPIEIGAALDGVRVFGGLNCDGDVWTYAVDRPSAVRTSSSQVPLIIRDIKNSVRIEDFEFTAAGESANGGSSIAALVIESRGVYLGRVKLQAGAGGDGADGKDSEGATDAGGRSNYVALSNDHDWRVMGSSAEIEIPGLEQRCEGVCSNGEHSTGGKGGEGNEAASNGQQGTPLYSTSEPQDWNGQGGKGKDCDKGGNGANGSDGPSGNGGRGATRPGILTREGWKLTAGEDGKTALVGQGGGGGAGVLDGNGLRKGGGGGGCGGCGGLGGQGGKSGGSSFGLLAFRSEITLEGGGIATSNGGKGGRGGAGQIGQQGGAPGWGTPPACDGGRGGKGGDGGPGGGGAGGHSIGIAKVMSTVQRVGSVVAVAGIRATGGKPGRNSWGTTSVEREAGVVAPGSEAGVSRSSPTPATAGDDGISVEENELSSP